VDGDNLKLPFGDTPLPEGLRGKISGKKDVIAGMRPEHFEDAAVAAERGIKGMQFTAKVDVVESMGSELYAYFDVHAAAQSSELDDLAKDAGLGELPGQSGDRDETHVVARLDPQSRAAAGQEIELVLDTSGVKVFDPNGGGNLAASQAAASAAAASSAGAST
jgi:multiple sugar transport system ATP-binding protein